MTNPPEELLEASFFGPWVPQPGRPQRNRQHFMSLAHWYESMKFMPAQQALREGVLHSPTIKEARKFAKAHQTEWRNDWNLVRHSVLIAGLGFLTLDRPDLAIPATERSELLASLQDLHLPDRFVTACLERYSGWAAGPRICSYGANAAPGSVVGQKFSKIVQNHPSWTLVSLCNNKTAWRLHDWALAHYVPVQYVGTPETRSTGAVLEQMVMASDHLVVFEVKRGKGSDSMIRLAKARKKLLTLELYDGPTALTGRLPVE